MMNVNATSFRKNMFSMLEQTIKYNETVNITTKDGNAVLLSEEEYKDIIATFEIYNNSELYAKVLKGMETPVEECVPESEVEW